jgi:nucleotide-binding universal stress UspA family protein
MYANIVVALDGSSVAEQVLPCVEALAERFASTLTLVRAFLPIESAAALVPPSVAGVPLDSTQVEDTIEFQDEEAMTYLERVAKALRQRGLVVRTECPQDLAAEAIVEVARRTNADLIALTTHGRGGLGRLVHGSISESVLRAARCPILLVRATNER